MRLNIKRYTRLLRRTALVIVILALVHLTFKSLQHPLIPEGILAQRNLSERCNALFKSDFPTTDFDDGSMTKIQRQIQLIRLYGHCFLRKRVGPSEDLDLEAVERKLFPVLHISAAKQLPKCRGRGIVMSISDYGVVDFNNLIKVLDLLGNELPIEAYYVKGLYTEYLGSLNFGRQNVTLIDAAAKIPSQHIHRYQRFLNKWIPLLLNPFCEFIFLDTDIVPFVQPGSLFLTEQYLESGSLFFRDRALDELISRSALKMYRSLLPGASESHYFELEQQDPMSIGRNRHTMESGVVLLDKRKYFPGLLIAASMHFYERTSEPLWGDKDLFWIGQKVSGASEFQFSNRSAGGIGMIETLSDHKVGSHRRVCSIQPAHMDEGDNLLWMNGGMRKCKLNSYDKDWKESKYLREKYQSKDEMREDFLGPMKANGVIVAPRVQHSWLTRLRGKVGGYMKNPAMGCNGYTWCAFDTEDHPGHVLQFDSKQQLHFDTILQTWWAP